MTLQIEGVWCKTRTEFEKLAKSGDYDLTISYFDIVNRLVKSDPYSEEPSDVIVSLYIRKLIKKLITDNTEKENEHAKLLYMFKNLDGSAILNFKDFISDLTGEPFDIDLVIINRCDYPKRGVLSKFDNVRFIDHD
jgi:hypothetical protein|tara:strand:- start:5911 stop:6318 length:408 start_codon:yes stop_codon:yes gene_type:complete